MIGLYAYRLDMPLKIHFVQLTKRLRLTATNPLSDQQLTDTQLLKVAATIKREYKVERILNEKAKQRKRKQYLIK